MVRPPCPCSAAPSPSPASGSRPASSPRTPAAGWPAAWAAAPSSRSTSSAATTTGPPGSSPWRTPIPPSSRAACWRAGGRSSPGGWTPCGSSRRRCGPSSRAGPRPSRRSTTGRRPGASGPPPATRYRHQLRQRAEPATRIPDVSWSLDEGELLVWAASRKAVEEIAAGIEAAFEVRLGPASAGAQAARSKLPDDALAPTPELLGLAGEEVARGEA